MALKKAWKLIQEVTIIEDDGKETPAIKIGKVDAIDNFLGCSHHFQEFKTQDG